MLHLLLHYELNVNELVRIMNMGQSRVSRHLKILSDSGLLASGRDGSYMYYSAVRNQEVEHLIRFIIQMGSSCPEFERDLENAQQMLEERKHQVRDFFNDLAEDWDRLKQEVLGDFSLARFIPERVSGSFAAADLGCGTGEMILELARYVERVIGVDSSSRMLEKARSRLKETQVDADLRLGELEHLPMRNEEADLVVMEMVLRHVAVPLEGLKEVSRVLKPGGIFLMAEFDSHDQEALRHRYGGIWAGFTIQQLRDWLEAAGLSSPDFQQHPVHQGLKVNVCTAVKP